jgi:hypothetical protein
MIKKFIPFLALPLLLWACGSRGHEPQGCTRGTPTPLLDSTWTSLEKYQFKAQGQQALERGFFPKLQLSLEIAQSGCDTANVEFRFLSLAKDSLPEQLSAPDCAVICADFLGNLYQLNQAPQDFLGLALRIDQAADSFRFGQAHYLSELNCWASVDRIKDSQMTLFVLKIRF